MSVNLINHIARPVTIADELESFFHVLVYYGVRYLRSNCTSVDSWIDNYFHNYAGPGCSRKSVTIEMTGMLEIGPLQGPLLFRSPMDRVLVPILKCLTAHYKVRAYEIAKTIPPLPRRATPPPTPPNSVLRIIRKADKSKLDPDRVARWKASFEAPPVDDFTPTTQDRELARMIADHNFMLGHLARALENPYWQGDDRIPATQSPDASLAHADGKTFSPETAKWQRISGFGRIVSLPARLHPSSVRLQTRARTRLLPARR